MTQNRWLQMIEENPSHSQWYIERFRAMAESGDDLHGEARLIDAMAKRGSRVLDAGCGTGRVGGWLGDRGHTVVGVDLDPELIAVANADHPNATWIVGDLSEFQLADQGINERFDLAVCAGNVMTFLDPATRGAVLTNVAGHLASGGRLVVGFGRDRGYAFEDFFADVAEAGLHEAVRLATWDLQPFTNDADFLVAVLEH